MAQGIISIGRFKNQLELDPESLESILPRTSAEFISGSDSNVEISLQPQEWEKLTQILKHQLDKLSNTDHKILAIKHVGDIYENQLKDQERALRWWGTVLSQYFFVDLALEEIERLASLLNGWPLAVQIYLTALKRLESSEQRKVQIKLAQAYQQRLGDTGQAEKTYLVLLHNNNSDLEILTALESLYQNSQRYKELAQILRQKIEIIQDAELRKKFRLQLSELYEKHLDNYGLAAEQYQQIINEDKGNKSALEALKNLYLKQQKFRELLGVYEQLAALTADEKERAYYLQLMAEHCEETLNDRSRAWDFWQNLLEIRGQDHALLQLMAQRFYTKEHWPELAAVFERQAKLELDPIKQVQAYHALGRIYADKINDQQQALICAHTVLKIDPSNQAALQILTDLYENLEDWDHHLEMLYRLIDLAPASSADTSYLKKLFLKVARVEGELLHNNSGAINAWWKVAELDPKDFSALKSLANYLRQESRFTELCNILEQQLLLIDSNQSAQIEILLDIAEISRHELCNFEAAIAGYKRILDLSPTHDTANYGLFEVYQELERWDEQIAHLLSWGEKAKDPRLSVKLLKDISAIYEDKLKQPEKAYLVWQSAFAVDRNNQEVRANLERLATSLNKWNDLIEIYQTSLPDIIEAKSKISILVAIAQYYLNQNIELEQAILLLGEALKMDPEHLLALEALAGCYQRMERWYELIMVLKRHADLEKDPALLVEIYSVIAALQDAKFNEGDQAIATWKKVLELDAMQLDALNALERLYYHGKYWPHFIELQRRRLELADTTEEKIARLNQIGETNQLYLADHPAAIAAYKQVLALDAHNAIALKALQDLYETSGEAEAYLEMIERQLDASATPQEKIESYPKIALAWEEDYHNQHRAIDCWEKLLTQDINNEQAFVQLERLYLEKLDFTHLLKTLERHLTFVDDSPKRLDLFMAIGQVCVESLGDYDRAITAYKDALLLDSKQKVAIEALSKLYEKLGHWPLQAETLARQIELENEATKKAALFYQLGRIKEQQQNLPEQAAQYYEQAIQLDEAQLDSRMRLIEIYQMQKDWEATAAMMLKAEHHTLNQFKKAQLLHDAGKIQLEYMHNKNAAMILFARTLNIDPEHLGAALPLARYYFDSEQYDKLEPILEMLARKIAPDDRQTIHEVYFKLGKTAERLGKIERAIKYLREAKNLEPRDLPTLESLAALEYQNGELDEAFRNYQQLLIHHRDEIHPQEIVFIFYRLGDIKAKAAQWHKSISFHEKALEANPTYRPSLTAMSDIFAQLNDWQGVVKVKLALLPIAAPEERFAILQECGDIYFRKLNQLDVAIETYHAAAALNGDDRVFLNNFLEILTAAKKWPDAVKILVRIAELETNNEICAKYFYTAAVICRDELNDTTRAIYYFNQSLDQDPSSQLKSFEAIDRICTQDKDWTTLEHNYELMLKRLTADAPAELTSMLWHNLGEIYRTRLSKYDLALSAFKKASQLEPKNLERHAILAELYLLLGPDFISHATSELHFLIEMDPKRIESYRSLRNIYASQQRLDEVFCILSTLASLKLANEEEANFLAARGGLRPANSIKRATNQFTEMLWKAHVVPREQNQLISEVYAVIAPSIIELTSRPAKDLGVKRAERINPKSPQPVAQLFHYICEVLNLPAAKLYLKSQQVELLLFANTKKDTSILINEVMFNCLDERQLAFVFGQQLTLLRPEYFLGQLFPSLVQLKTFFGLAIKLCFPDFPLPPEETREINQLVEQITPVMSSKASVKSRLAELLNGFTPENFEALNLALWRQNVGLTANRTAFILSGDLNIAAQNIQSMPSPFGAISATDRFLDLVRYSVSPEYFNVRKLLGLNI